MEHKLLMYISIIDSKERELTKYKNTCHMLNISLDDTLDNNLERFVTLYAQRKVVSPSNLIDDMNDIDRVWNDKKEMKWQTVPTILVYDIVEDYITHYHLANSVENILSDKYAYHQDEFAKFNTFYNGEYIPHYNSQTHVSSKLSENSVSFDQFITCLKRILLMNENEANKANDTNEAKDTNASK